jgi:hypothetical protein
VSIVRGKITRPDGSAITTARVRFALKGQTRAFVSADDETLVGYQEVAVDGTGLYSLDLPGQTLINPANTRWQREVIIPGQRSAIVDELIVPAAGGPYWEEDILADPLVALPTVGASAELDDFEITSNGSPVGVNGLTVASLDTRGDLVIPAGTPRNVWVQYAVGVASSVANANIVVGVGPTGTTDVNQMYGAGWAQAGAIASVVTVPLLVRRPAGWTGTLRLYAMSAQGGNVTLQGSAFAPTRGVAMLAGNAA